MVRSTTAVAALLLLVMSSGGVVTAACEMACFYATSMPPPIRSESSVVNRGHGCHEPAASSETAVIVAPAPHVACAHREAEPFVVAAKSVFAVDAYVVNVHGSPQVERHGAARSGGRHAEGTPVGPSATRALPLRI